VTAGAVILLRDQQFNPEAARVLRKMRPERQVEVVELMISANAINVTYAEALLNATPPEQLADRPPKIKPAVTPEQLAKLERKMDKVQGQYQQAEHTYGADLLHLTVAKGYLTKLLGNEAVRRYLGLHQAEIFREFQALVEIEALDARLPEDYPDEGGGGREAAYDDIIPPVNDQCPDLHQTADKYDNRTIENRDADRIIHIAEAA
jgi:hypothetical protein